MRLHHIAFGCALICAGFAWGAPMSWVYHAGLTALTLALCVLGLALATGAAMMELVHPGRRERRYTQRQLDRAFRHGRDSGIGPSEATLARWRRQGFGAPGVGR
jgi:hypothetical protein